MRLVYVLALLVPAWVLAAQGGPEPTRSTEVFTGGGEQLQPREKPAQPVTTYWRVRLSLRMTDMQAGAHLQVLLPLSDDHQQILGRSIEMDGFTYREEPEPPNLWGYWERNGAAVKGLQIEYDVNVALTDTVRTIPSTALAEHAAADVVHQYLQPSRLVQSGDPEFRRRARDLTKDAHTIEQATWALFQYTAAFVRTGAGAAQEDALTVLRNGQGSSAGKARLLTALLRSGGIPARVVGGLKLEDSSKKRATISWVEAFLGGNWVPLDPSGGYFGWLPNHYLALYRDDLPLIVHSAGLPLEYDFFVHRTSRDAIARQPEPLAIGAGRAETRVGAERVRTAASYVERAVASVVVIADQSVPDAVSDRMLREAQADQIDLVILHARFESRYFREQYLQRLVDNNLALIRKAHVLLVATHDDAGLYALMTLGEKKLPLGDMRIVISGGFPRSVGTVLGAVLYRLVSAGEVVLVNRPQELLGLWEMVRANVIDGVPMVEEATKWEMEPLVLDQRVVDDLSPWRRWIIDAWGRGVTAQVPLQALTLILVLPVIAAIIVVARTVVGVETFGTFSPVIVSLAFLTTGLQWGAAIFAVIVGVGALVRALLQHVRLQLVARLGILIAVVAGVMAALTVVGASFGIGALMNVSIFPMVIMSNVIENFSSSQAEFGTREAVRLTINTLGLAAVCYLAIDGTGLQSLLLAFPELLVGAVAVDIALGKWRGLRLLEYLRFFDLTRRSDRWAP
ncbi:MAG: transglutaminase domain protein [Deltaproteobacteria bacterium]|nr:transglutaminase domain protein [Deltaproteobacteria bacterium]